MAEDKKLGLIYGIIDPRYGISRYVGWAQYETKKFGLLNESQTRDRRFEEHLDETKSKAERNTKKLAWLRKLFSLGILPTPIIIKRDVYIDDEDYWIEFYRKECIALGTTITNTHPGGKGGSEKGRKGKKHTKEWKEEASRRMKIINNGRTPWNKGLTKETDERVAAIAAKVKHPKKSHQRPYHIFETRECACGCGQTFECTTVSKKKFLHGHRNNGWKLDNHIIEIRACKCGCGEAFECPKSSKKRFIQGHCKGFNSSSSKRFIRLLLREWS